MHSRFEEYLDQVDRRLASLPAWERREWREEAQAHLEALAEAHEELGRTPEEAVEAAIRQFGDPDLLGKELHRTSPAVTEGRREASRQLAWSAHTLTWLTLVTIGSLHLWLFGIHRAQEFSARGGLYLPTTLLVFWLGLAAGGTVLGWGSGRSSLGRSVIASYVLLLVAALVLTGTLSILTPITALAACGVVGAGLRLSSRAARWGAHQRRRSGQLLRR